MATPIIPAPRVPVPALRPNFPIDFNGIRAALVNLVQGVTGLTCIVEERKAQISASTPRPPLPYCSFKITTPAGKIGTDSIQPTGTSDEPSSVWKSGGVRKMVVSFKCYAQIPEIAVNYMALLEAAFDTEPVQSTLRASGVAFWEIASGTIDISALLTAGYEGRASLDASFGVPSNLYVDLGEIDSVPISLTTEDGDASITVTLPPRLAEYVDKMQLSFAGGIYPDNGPYLSYGNLFRPQPNQRWALSWWMKQVVLASANVTLFSNNDNGAQDIGLSLSTLSGPNLDVYWGKNASNFIDREFDLSGIVLTEPHHYLLAWDGISTMSLWVDGVPRPTVFNFDVGVVDSVAYSVPTTFASQCFFSAFKGFLNDCALGVGGRMPTTADAQRLYNGGSPGDIRSTALIEIFQNWYWNGEAGDTSSVIYDRLGRSNAAMIGGVQIVNY